MLGLFVTTKHSVQLPSIEHRSTTNKVATEFPNTLTLVVLLPNAQSRISVPRPFTPSKLIAVPFIPVAPVIYTSLTYARSDNTITVLFGFDGTIVVAFK